ncbi:M20 aminoacylase family protein [Oceanospirillum sanctuarii]|uniref:M20 aminoacylase family protein n=1 Tax=Oceanospirillum sanctuarii TaxID=1434821 RepID=UPI000A384DB5|nr:M20 aminoacylase family protein [Oceanospirillum sanctuarii]
MTDLHKNSAQIIKPVIEAGSLRHKEMIQWRHQIHAHPELAYLEQKTSDLIAAKLAEWGIEFTRNWAETGIMARIKGQGGAGPTIALRADMDALPLQEKNTFEHRSRHDGQMHACGHDGHTTMLLGAAKYLAEHPDFCGEVVLIFQPAEEGQGGARVMVNQGIFKDYPADYVFGLHNWPGLEAGHVAVHDGPVMAGMDTFEVLIEGEGGHGAMPHLGVDPTVIAAQLITAFQSVVSRNISPLESGVISVTQMNAGTTTNIIPGSVTLKGTTRALNDETHALLHQRMSDLVQHTCAGFGATGSIAFGGTYPATINQTKATQSLEVVAKRMLGDSFVQSKLPPSMGAEDFSYFLQEIPGCYFWLGNGPTTGSCTLHSPHYDFNDEILATGASLWVALAYHHGLAAR